MFGIKDGFDIVIGNPPYVESRHPSFRNDLKELYQKSCKNRWGDDAKFITKGADLLIYFFESSIFFINKAGCIILITQNAWLDTAYGIKAQAFLKKYTNVISVLDSQYRYFPSGEGPNINTVITLFKGKEVDPFNKIRFYLLKDNIENIKLDFNQKNNIDNEQYKLNLFSYDDKIVSKYKWGILHNTDSFLIDIINILEKKATDIDNIPSESVFRFGQGLNLSKSFFIPVDILNKYNIHAENCFPIFYKGAPFHISHTDWYLVRKNKVNNLTKEKLRQDGYDVFDENSTKKEPPVLIMPRGISRHFCSLNGISAYSLSGVDVYASDISSIEKEILNLWCFFNSSLFWLLREISGRKNLGGGLLKSEATDLKTFPVYLSLNIEKDRFLSLCEREAMETRDEILTDEHKMIDRIIFDYLELDKYYRDKCLIKLNNLIKCRLSKSVT
ncbi:MAG: Eco57I restriction-modification methylase domain-containing protein [Desulfobacterales bacterium]